MAEPRHSRRELTPAQQARLANGKRWKPGESGNPAGPKPGLRNLRELLEAAMREARAGQDRPRIDEMVANLSDKLALTEPHALDVILRRIWPAPLAVEITGDILVRDGEREAFITRVESSVTAQVPARNGHDAASDLAPEPDPDGTGGVP